jgi:hypothetical protein
MSWELYEVWSVDRDGHEELVDTTRSLKEAQEIASATLDEDIEEVVIYRETEDGDLEEIERFN